MVRLFMKQEYISMQNRIIVKDESGKDVFLIVGKWGRVGDALSLYSLDGNLIAEAKQTFLSIFPKFDLYYEGEKVASVVKRPGIRDPYFTVSKLNWVISGNFSEKRYTIRHYTELIMKLEKSHSYTGDFYSLLVMNEEHAPLCCLLSVIVDHYSPRRSSLRQLQLQSRYSLGFYQPVFGFSTFCHDLVVTNCRLSKKTD